MLQPQKQITVILIIDVPPPLQEGWQEADPRRRRGYPADSSSASVHYQRRTNLWKLQCDGGSAEEVVQELADAVRRHRGNSTAAASYRPGRLRDLEESHPGLNRHNLELTFFVCL